MPMPRIERPVETPRARRPIIPVVDTTIVAPPSRWRLESLVGLIASLLVHLCILSAMTYVVFELNDNDQPGALSGLIGDPNGELPADFLSDGDVMLEVGGSKQEEDLFSPATSAFSDVGSRVAGGSILGGNGEGDGAGDGEGSGAGISVGVPAINVPAHAVTKGSFSAWTVPKDPEPGANYDIVIQVRLPEKFVKNGRYKVGDVTGVVKGTDGYELPIRFNSGKLIRPEDGEVSFMIRGRNGRYTPAKAVVQADGVLQLSIVIPGAAQLVRDTIRIESRVLKEKQTLEIVF